METVADYKEIIDVIKESGGEAFKLCFQCELWDTVCPWNSEKIDKTRKMIPNNNSTRVELQRD